MTSGITPSRNTPPPPPPLDMAEMAYYVHDESIELSGESLTDHCDSFLKGTAVASMRRQVGCINVLLLLHMYV